MLRKKNLKSQKYKKLKNIKNFILKKRTLKKPKKYNKLKNKSRKNTKGGASRKKLEQFNNTVKGLLNNISITSIMGNNPLIKNSPKKEKLESIQQAQNIVDMKEQIKQEDENISQSISTTQPSFVNSLKKKETTTEDVDSQPKGLFNSLGKRLGMNISNAAKRISTPTLTGKLKEVSEDTDRIKQMSRQQQCDAQFITGLETLLNTCSKKEAINIYNECVRILKTKKRSFSQRLMNDIETINLLNYDDKGEERKEVLVPGVALRKMGSDRITRLETEIDSTLGIKKPKNKKRLLK